MAQAKAPSKNVYQVEVSFKSHLTDTAGLSALALLKEAGLNTTCEVRSGRLYEISGHLSPNHIHQAAKDILCDPITEDYVLLGSPLAANGGKGWRVTVWLKEPLKDPIGESVRSVMAEMGLPSPEKVRAAFSYKLNGYLNRPQLEKALRRAFPYSGLRQVTLLETVQ